MARKEQITKQIILDGAFSLLREQGIAMVTARKLASYIGCSTQPIFRIYEGMADLKKDVYEKSVEFYEEFYGESDKSHDIPFVDLGLPFWPVACWAYSAPLFVLGRTYCSTSEMTRADQALAFFFCPIRSL